MFKKLFALFFTILTLLSFTACASVKKTVRVTLPETESISLDEDFSPFVRADFVVVQAENAQDLIDKLKDHSEFGENKELYSSVIAKLSEDNIPIYQNSAYSNEQYTIRILQLDNETGEYLSYDEIDIEKPYIIEVLCSFSYDGVFYKMIYSPVFELFTKAFELTATAGERIVTVYGNQLPNGKLEATTFTIDGFPNLYLRLNRNMPGKSFLGEFVKDDELILPLDFFELESLYIK